jgi:ribosome biogenesis protein ERB1
MAEYLPTPEEAKAWRNAHEEDRQRDFLPQKSARCALPLVCWRLSHHALLLGSCRHTSLRLVPAYEQFIHERFQRCLDLYLCPRARKLRVCRPCQGLQTAVTAQSLVHGR